MVAGRQRCRNCDKRRREYLTEALDYNCATDPLPLCSRFDLRTVELTCQQRGGPVPLVHHIEIAKSVQDGHAAALAELNRYRSPMPDTAEDMIESMCKLHAKIFGESRLFFAGKIRQEDEPPVSFGTGKNERDGAPPSRIIPELHELYSEVILYANLPGIVDVQTLARRCAMFLEHFFRIHPFHDGNGRVARLLIRMMANKTRRFVIEVVPDDKHSHGKYVEALEYAHRHAGYKGDGSGAILTIISCIG